VSTTRRISRNGEMKANTGTRASEPSRRRGERSLGRHKYWESWHIAPMAKSQAATSTVREIENKIKYTDWITKHWYYWIRMTWYELNDWNVSRIE
jgi:hypothetical protein